MMKFTSRLHKKCNHSSLLWHKSEVAPGVGYAIRRVSLLQRIELTKKVRELTIKHEFLNSGENTDKLTASLADLLVRRLYLEWGLAELNGLIIDDQPATVERLIEKGPEVLSDEIVTKVREELGLSEEERKNF